MKVLLLGSGGREHALSWKMAQSSMLTALYVAPGNAGTATVATNVALEVNDFQSIKSFVLEKQIDMVVVGPEDPLVNGIVDFFSEDQQLCHVQLVGPGKAGARLEGSKEFAKQFMQQNAIPTARYASFTASDLALAEKFLTTMSPPYVLKADGLAAGKGVLILNAIEEAKAALKTMLHDGKFGEAGRKVVIEEFLSGIELSVFVLTDGKSYKILPTAKDYKRIGEGDTGLNTGGMGAVSPVPFADAAFMHKVEERIVKPTVQGLAKAGIPYRGFIFIGLMAVNSEPYVIEYNVRMGDPETEVVIPRIKSDLLDLFSALDNGTLDKVQVEEDERTVATVMQVSGGYPEAYEKGKEMKGMETVDNSILFHAGTKMDNNMLITNGGRVLAVTAYGSDKNEALRKAYNDASKVDFEGCYYRKDIGFDL
jgi:phosphoribosylamine--glycine ligase